jgi:hypothetical protein
VKGKGDRVSMHWVRRQEMLRRKIEVQEAHVDLSCTSSYGEIGLKGVLRHQVSSGDQSAPIMLGYRSG